MAWKLLWLAPASVIVLGGIAIADDPTPVVGDDAVIETPGDIPELTAEDIRKADQLISADPVVSAVLAKGEDQKLEEGPWHNSALDLLGISRIVKFSEPIDLGRLTLPAVAWDTAEDGYIPFEFKYVELSGVTEIRILVDLHTDEVVAATPLVAKEIIPDESTEFPTVKDGGLG